MKSVLHITIRTFRIYYKSKMNLICTIETKNVRLESLNIKTFVFLDSETTGLPAQEHNKTKLTELSLVAVEADHIRLGVFPRVQNKLTLCFNPRKMVSFEAERITGTYMVYFILIYILSVYADHFPLKELGLLGDANVVKNSHST